MKRFTFTLQIVIYLIFITFITDVKGSERIVMKGLMVYRNSLTYIAVDSCYKTAYFYETDDNPHPILSGTIYRGEFNIIPIKDNFYSLNSELPGKSCIDNIDIRHTSHYNSINITVKLKLGNSTKQYYILAKSTRSGATYQIEYPQEDELCLPVEVEGYEFSIKPLTFEYYSYSALCPGFGHSLKYLNLPVINKSFFSTPGSIEISLPLFNDDIFNRWCLNGEIMRINKQILNDKIIWHGKEFKLYEKSRFFLF